MQPTTAAAAQESSGGAPDEDDSGAFGSTSGPEGTRLDLPHIDPDGYVPMGCEKVDFLFVVDNSDSMRGHQESLRASFPGFIETVESTLEEVTSYHLGVVTTDAYEFNLDEQRCREVGGLVTRTGGANSSDALCGPYAEGHNFMTELDDLSTAFSCAASVGTDGDPNEAPVFAMTRVITGDLDGAGECNEGFLREDALLVVVLLTDCGTFGPPGGSPQDWFDLIVGAKTYWQNVVVVSVIEQSDSAQNKEVDGRRLAEFTEMFQDNGLVGDVAEPDYSPLFAEAVGRISLACDAFVPPA
ncbi:MAG: hypothetical protein ACRBN8_02085 [Nannocystales bacterium]